MLWQVLKCIILRSSQVGELKAALDQDAFTTGSSQCSVWYWLRLVSYIVRIPDTTTLAWKGMQTSATRVCLETEYMLAWI